MPTTTKMGIVYPSSTDLVKDGATAMGTISTTVDSKTGLVLLNTTSFSAVSSVSLPNSTFTSTFDDYKIILEITTSSATGYMWSRLRASGSDNSTANYSCSMFVIAHGSSSASNDNGGTGQTSFNKFGYLYSGTALYGDITLFNPNKALFTGYSGLFNTGNSGENWLLGGRFNGTTSFDSISFNPPSGTFTGNIYTFGINK